MRRFSDRQSLHSLNELNVTPMLDLAFVLLIIFMITTPLMENSVDLHLPSSEAAKNAVDPQMVQTITINPAAQIALNGQPLELADLESRLLALTQEKPDAAVVIRSDRDLAVQKLIDVMDAVKHAKITKIGVVTNPATP